MDSRTRNGYGEFILGQTMQVICKDNKGNPVHYVIAGAEDKLQYISDNLQHKDKVEVKKALNLLSGFNTPYSGGKYTVYKVIVRNVHGCKTVYDKERDDGDDCENQG